MFPQHNTDRFIEYTPLPKGFKIPNGDRFIFDDHQGWADIDGCYYDKDCIPAGWIVLNGDKYVRYDMNKNIVEEGTNKCYGKHKLTIKEARELLIEEQNGNKNKTLKQFQQEAYEKQQELPQRQSKLKKYWKFVLNYKILDKNYNSQDLHEIIKQITNDYEIKDNQIISRLDIKNDLLKILQQKPLIFID